METTFVNLKSELTTQKEALEAQGLEVFRTRMNCNCKYPFNFRYGLLVVANQTNEVARVIKCKSCASASEKGGAKW